MSGLLPKIFGRCFVEGFLKEGIKGSFGIESAFVGKGQDGIVPVLWFRLDLQEMVQPVGVHVIIKALAHELVEYLGQGVG